MKERQYLDELHALWKAWNRETNELNAKLTNIDVELERDVRDFATSGKSDPDQTGMEAVVTQPGEDSSGTSPMIDLENRTTRMRLGQERIQSSEALLKSLTGLSEKLLAQLDKQSEICCSPVDSVDGSTNRRSRGTDSARHKLINLFTSPHAVATRYRELQERTRRLKSRWEKLNDDLDSQLDARDRLLREMDKLAQWLSVAEKRLTKLTRVWVAARPPVNVVTAEMPSLGSALKSTNAGEQN